MATTKKTAATKAAAEKETAAKETVKKTTTKAAAKTEEAPEETSSPEPSAEEVNESSGTEINPDEFSTDGMDDIPSFEDSSKDSEPASLESLSPEETVPEDSFGTGSFDTSDIKDLDFSNEGNSDFALGSLDGAEGDYEFSIPGFSDTETADLDKKPDVETPDFSGAAELNEKDKPKNTFTDAEYKRFLKNLATYPLNVRIALEDFVVKNEFTDDAIFAVLEKVLRKAPARQVATELEKLLDIPLDVPRDFERRSVAEYEAYKKEKLETYYKENNEQYSLFELVLYYIQQLYQKEEKTVTKITKSFLEQF